MRIVPTGEEDIGRAAPPVSDLRAVLRSFKGIASRPDESGSASELRSVLAAGYPVFAAEKAGQFAGCAVCRIGEGASGSSSSSCAKNTADRASVRCCLRGRRPSRRYGV